VGARIIEIPHSRLLAGLAITFTVGIFGVLILRLGSTRNVGPATHAPMSTLQPEFDTTGIAENFAVAFNAVDCRDREAWLASMRPLTTEREFRMLEAIYVPISWGLFERDERVVRKDQIIAMDQGLLASGQDWQARLVEVAVTGVSPQRASSTFQMRILLTRARGTWRVASLLTEEEVEAMLAATNGGRR
jgi:hypothetical protein